MKLKTAHVRMFRNVIDSSLIEIDPEVTALVGKNESGKTSTLQALARLHPARPVGAFKTLDDYPAWLEKQHRRQGQNLDAVRPIEATFEIEDADRAFLDERFGPGVVTATTVTVACTYGNVMVMEGFLADEQKAVAQMLARSSVAPEIDSELAGAATIADVRRAALSMKGKGTDANVMNAGATIEKALTAYVGDRILTAAIEAVLLPRVPRFFYFSSYSSLPDSIKIRDLLTKAKATKPDLTDDERTAVALLRQAATDDSYLLNAEYEVRKRELENVANAITDEVLKYWTQNQDLRVTIDLTQVMQPAAPGGQQSVIDELKIRVYDDRHRLSLPFSGRSSGFQWFFSFLAAFAEHEATKEPIVILLDEPALGLHARAQADFLRFIDERLAQNHQVIYTTHSPFMVQPNHLERVRVVEDRGRERGSIVSKEVLATDPDTLFPLQGALGYDLAQHLFVAPHNLVVEGTSDFTYLIVISDFLKEKNREGLDSRWSIVPVGGAEMVPSFVALLGHHLDVTVLIDSQRAGNQRLARLAADGILARNRILKVGDVLGVPVADIEDIFDLTDYVVLYNRAFTAQLEATDMTGTDPIVSRIARRLGVDRFDHGKPADVLLRRRDEILPTLTATTLDRFEKLFRTINATLRVPGATTS